MIQKMKEENVQYDQEKGFQVNGSVRREEKQKQSEICYFLPVIHGFDIFTKYDSAIELLSEVFIHVP